MFPRRGLCAGEWNVPCRLISGLCAPGQLNERQRRTLSTPLLERAKLHLPDSRSSVYSR